MPIERPTLNPPLPNVRLDRETNLLEKQVNTYATGCQTAPRDLESHVEAEYVMEIAGR